VKFMQSALAQISSGYAREAGVRGLENNIKKILRKIAVQIAKGQEGPKKKARTKQYILDDRNVETYLGKPIYPKEKLFEKMPVGVCTGLAWTANGGVTLYIETVEYDSPKTGMKLTGQAGSVMKESSEIAWSYLHSSLDHYAPNQTFFPRKEVHIHIPEGATPKDGPSAGVTMVTAILSLLLGKAVSNNLAMTGEITLTGRVLPIGGLKEKLIAARRAEIKTLIFPNENLRDYDELPDYLKKDLQVHFVEHYDEIFKIVFGEKVFPGKALGARGQKKNPRA
jgi:ATP-dependent Lon protease